MDNNVCHDNLHKYCETQAFSLGRFKLVFELLASVFSADPISLWGKSPSVFKEETDILPVPPVHIGMWAGYLQVDDNSRLNLFKITSMIRCLSFYLNLRFHIDISGYYCYSFIAPVWEFYHFNNSCLPWEVNMNFRRCLTVLITLTVLLLFANVLGQAASKAQVIGSPNYLPLVFKDSTYFFGQLGFIGVDANNYANTYIYRVKQDGSGLQNLTVAPTPFLSFSWSPDGSKIAFNSYWAGNDEIYVMNADGSTITRLTFEPGADEFPAWSPDGTHIAFTSNRQGSPQVYVMGADGSTVIRLTNLLLGCGNHIWSPDGSRIAFNNFNAAFNDGEIYLVKPDGTGLQRLTDNGFFDSIKAWSPDGSKILFLSNRDWSGADDREDVYVMNKDGTDPIRLTVSGYIQDASWSPDGTKIAYSDSSATQGLFIMDPDGTDVTEILCQSNHIGTFDSTWSPDAKSITYAPSSGGGLYTVRIDGSGCFQLTSMLANNPQWRPAK